MDGDRGGEIILKELSQVADIDYVAKTPKGKEVEDLDKKEVIMALRRKVPLSQVNSYRRVYKKQEETVDNKGLLNLLREVKGKLIARLLDEKLELITEVEIKDLVSTLNEVQPYCIVLDGIVTQRLIDSGSESKVKYIVGVSKSKISEFKGVRVLTERL